MDLNFSRALIGGKIFNLSLKLLRFSGFKCPKIAFVKKGPSFVGGCIARVGNTRGKPQERHSKFFK